MAAVEQPQPGNAAQGQPDPPPTSWCTLRLLSLTPMSVFAHLHLGRWGPALHRIAFAFLAIKTLRGFGALLAVLLWVYDICTLRRVVAEHQPGKNAKTSRDTTAMLLPPLGLFGPHHYYHRRWFHGLAYTLTLGGLGGVWLWDVCSRKRRQRFVAHANRQKHRDTPLLQLALRQLHVWVGPYLNLFCSRVWDQPLRWKIPSMTTGDDTWFSTSQPPVAAAVPTTEGTQVMLGDKHDAEEGRAPEFAGGDAPVTSTIGLYPVLPPLPSSGAMERQRLAPPAVSEEDEAAATPADTVEDEEEPLLEWWMSVLTILPLSGLLGLQHFYHRRWRIGLVYLVSPPLSAIGWLVDIFYVKKNHKEASARLAEEEAARQQGRKPARAPISKRHLYVSWLISGLHGGHMFVLGQYWLWLGYLASFGGIGILWLLDLCRLRKYADAYDAGNALPVEYMCRRQEASGDIEGRAELAASTAVALAPPTAHTPSVGRQPQLTLAYGEHVPSSTCGEGVELPPYPDVESGGGGNSTGAVMPGGAIAVPPPPPGSSIATYSSEETPGLGGSPARPRSSNKSLWVAFVCFLPFGGLFGLHHFYLGRYLHGALAALTWNFVGIGWVVDAFMLRAYVAEANKDRKWLF